MKIYNVRFTLTAIDDISVEAINEKDAYTKALALVDVSNLNARVVGNEILSVEEK